MIIILISIRCQDCLMSNETSYLYLFFVKRDVHHRDVSFGGSIGARFNLSLQLVLVLQKLLVALTNALDLQPQVLQRDRRGRDYLCEAYLVYLEIRNMATEDNHLVLVVEFVYLLLQLLNLR